MESCLDNFLPGRTILDLKIRMSFRPEPFIASVLVLVVVHKLASAFSRTCNSSPDTKKTKSYVPIFADLLRRSCFTAR